MKKLFDEKWYLNTYEEVKEYPGTPYEHYIKIGWKKGYDPSFFFSTTKYLETYPDVMAANICPLLHYKNHGKFERRKTFSLNPIYDGNYKERKLMFIPKYIGRFLYSNTIKKNKNKKILVIFHMYYINSFKEVKYYLNNLSCYNYDLYITYDKDNYNEKVLNDIRTYKNDVHFLPVENRGFDLGPFFDCINNVNLDNYDIVFKIQSKGTFDRMHFSYKHLFINRDWFLYLFNSILGPFNVHKTIKKLTNNSNIGMVSAKNLIYTDPIHKKNFARLHLSKIGITPPDKYNFVGGTCFAQRANLLKTLKELNISSKDFEISEKGSFSLAHALERYICIIIQEQGYVLSGNLCNVFRQLVRKPFEIILYHITGMKIFRVPKLRNFKFSDDFILRALEPNLLFSYKLKDVALKDITVFFAAEPNKLYHIDELPPYKYLMDKEKNKELYINYCFEKRRTDFLHMNKTEFNNNIKNICCEKFDELIKNLEQNGYNEEYIIPLNESKMNILDGLHRASWLMYKYGGDKKIKVLILDRGANLKASLNKIFKGLNKFKSKLHSIKIFFKKLLDFPKKLKNKLSSNFRKGTK